MPDPILAYCGSRRYAVLMWALAAAGGGDVSDILIRCTGVGHDLETILPLLERIASKN